MSAYHGVR